MEFTYAPGIAWTLNPTHHVIVREYRQGTWHAVSDATVWAGGTTVQTNEQGMAFIPSRLDTRWFFAYKNGHVRSHGYHVTGQESVTVDVVLRSTPPKKIQTEQDSGSFIVYSPASTNYGIDFGTLDRGQTASHVFVVENTSNAPLTLSQVSLGYLRSSVTARVNDVPLHEFRASIEPGHRIEFRVAITANERVENVDFGKLAFVVTK
jgi:hypothetical protein